MPRRVAPQLLCDDLVMTVQDAPPGSAIQLRSSLAGVRALLLDLDGVVVMRGRPIPGAAEALERLDVAGIPYVLATNTSMVSRTSMALELARTGIAVEEERIVTAASAAAAYVRRRFVDGEIYLMVAPDAYAEFEGLALLSDDDAADPDAQAAAVVVGDAGQDFTPRNLQSAFTLLRGGARFVAMHKNRWWLTPAGTMLDSGAYVAALEYATERRAVVTGKPSRAFFEEGVRRLDYLTAGRRPSVAATVKTLAPGEVAMVGDDLWNDILGAQKAGLRGVFVRSGKHGDAELARISSARGGGPPDAVASSIVEVVAALLD